VLLVLKVDGSLQNGGWDEALWDHPLCATPSFPYELLVCNGPSVVCMNMATLSQTSIPSARYLSKPSTSETLSLVAS